MTASPAAPHLLTVLHAAELTGPPLFALQFLRWLRDAEPTWRCSTLFLDAGGPLEEPFEDLGRVVLARGRAPYSAGRSLARRALTWRGTTDLRQELGRDGAIDVAHVHCAGSFKVLAALPPTRVLGHLHELTVGQDLHLGPVARQHVRNADRYVAVSEGVREEFLRRFEVHPERVERQWGFVDPERIRVAVDGPRPSELPPDSVVVASAGVRHWRKAPELFVRVAQRVRDLAPEIPWLFVWIGGQDSGGLEDLVRRAGLDGLVRFLPHQPEPLAWIAAADLFLLTAREDAFPLVCVEAAAAGRPIVTFDSGGAAELVRAAGCGTVSPYLDLDHLAASVVSLAADPARRESLGSAGREFASNELLIERAGPRLLATLRRTMEAAG